MSDAGSQRRQTDERNARLYLLGLSASLVGNSAMTLVAGIWVKDLTGSSSAAGLVAVCIYAPSLFSPIAGVVVDRLRRRPFLIGVHLASALGLLPLLFVRADTQVWLIYAVMLLYGVSLVLVDPAENALFAIMLPEQIRQRVNGMRLALQEGGKLVAPLLGAGLFVLVGGGPVALVDAVTFLLAALAVWRLKIEEAPPVQTQGSWRADLAAGFIHIRQTPVLFATTVAGTVALFVAGVATPAQFSLVDAMARPPSFLGVLTGVLGAGSIIASISSNRVILRIGERNLAAAGLVNMLIGHLLAAWGTTPSALLGSFILGFALPWTVVALVNLAQRTTPDALQGRVSASITFVLFAPQPFAQAIGSALIDQTGYRPIYITTALVAVATAVWLLASRGRRPPAPEGKPS